MMRIALFLLTNLAVMVVFGLVLSLTGIQSSSMTGLLIMALLFGFGGSIVSLPNLKLVPHAVMCQFYLCKRQQAKKTV